jgi:subtilisin family serine protease
MQHKQSPIKLIYTGVLSIALVASITFFVHNASQQPHKPVLVPTQQVNEQNSVGGKPVAAKSSQTPSTPPAPTKSTTSQNPATVTTTSQAPKQEAITNSITVNYPYKALSSLPDDPYYAGSWLHQRTNTTSAWNVSTGSPVTIAIIDTGFALDHEDLMSQWKINNNESGSTIVGDYCWTGAPQNKSSNGCDDDQNGYIDDWRGWNFVNTTNNPQAGTNQAGGIEAISHGTAVAGLAGAATNNHIGIAASNWNAKLLPLTALDDSGSGTTTSVVAALYYAVDNGASIINVSLGGPSDDPALDTAIEYAYAHNVVVIAAAGNCGTVGDAGCGGLSAPMMMYPAKNNHVIAVGATDSTDTRASFSSYGPGIDVVAPGSGSLTSTLIDSRTLPYNYTNAYSATLYGTSFASPIVSGIASLIRSLRPTTSVDDITALIDGSATKTTGMNGQLYTNEYGHGVVNAGTATIIADTLSKSTDATPKLAQTGDYRSEHSFSPEAIMSSGCTAPALTYCTVRMTNNLGYDRYLPYVKTSAAGTVGWQWSGNILQSGEWTLSATQGALSSTNSYFLFSK